MNVVQLEEERRKQLVQGQLYSDLLDDLKRTIGYRHDNHATRTLTDKPVFVGLRKHAILPADETLKRLYGNVIHGYRIVAAVRGEFNVPGVYFTLHRSQSA